ncbi:MAG: acyltransferase [Gammaproteobacteria bacterium]|nr:acyltransferase [Gammaproteobacteria bacterium]
MKKIIKKAISFAFILLLSPLLIIHWIASITSNKGAFVFCNQLLSLIPGTIGSYSRVAFNSVTMTQCHNESIIGFGTLFSQQDTEIHQSVYIGPQCNIGSCIIEKNTLIASAVHIMSGTGQHNFEDLETPIQQQGGEFVKIKIGEDSWIGNGSLIMANIGKKCIIGAGSVVTKEIPDYSIAVGNPAKVIKNRLEN